MSDTMLERCPTDKDRLDMLMELGRPERVQAALEILKGGSVLLGYIEHLENLTITLRSAGKEFLGVVDGALGRRPYKRHRAQFRAVLAATSSEAQSTGEKG